MKIAQLINPIYPYPELSIQDLYFLKRHGLTGRVLKSGFGLTNDLELACKDEATKYFIRYEVFKKELEKFLATFPKAIPVKGMSLIPRLYHDPTIREVTDIDIYYPYDFLEIKQFFNEHHFTVSEDKWEANCFKLNATKVIEGVEVPFEIHHSLLWESECEWIIEEVNCRKSLRLEDELVYLCGHLAYQHTMLSLHWLIDIALIVQLPHQWDADRIHTILSKVPLKNSLSTCLWACEKYFQIKIPETLNPFILKNYQNNLIQRFTTENFLKVSSDDPVNYYLLKHLLKDSISQSIRYDMLWLKHTLWK